MSTGSERGVIPEAEGQGRLRQRGCGASLLQRSSKWPTLQDKGAPVIQEGVQRTPDGRRETRKYPCQEMPPTHLTGLKRPFGRKARKLMIEVEIGWCGG